MSSLDFNFLKVYKPVFNADHRYIDIWGGRGRGGSHFITDYFLFKLITADYFRGYFMRAVFGDIRNSLFQDLKDRIEEKETDLSFLHINEVEMSIKNPLNGNSILSKGFKKSSGSQTAKLKSIAGATDIAIEECEEVEEDDFNTLDISLRTVKADLHIYRVFNPPEKNHWLIKNHYNLIDSEQEDYFIAQPKGNNNHLSIFSTYHENRSNIDDVFVKILEGYKESNPDFYYSNVKGFVSAGKKGRVFRNIQYYKDLPERNYYRLYGLDFGYSPDPTVLTEVNINMDQKEIYIRERGRGLEMSTEEIYTMIKRENPEGHENICDNAEKREINALINYGLNVFKSQKGAGSRGAGRDLMKNFKIYLYQEDKEMIDEWVNHTWALDNKKLPTNKPTDGNDHSIDGSIYAVQYYINIYGFNLV